MNNLIWKIKSFFRKITPLLILMAVLYGGHSLYQQGVFRRGLKPAITSMLYKMPYFGTRFRHYNKSSSYSYRKAHRKGYRKHYGRRHGRRRR